MSSAVDNDLAEIVGLILGREIAPGADLVREDTPGWDRSRISRSSSRWRAPSR
uniref:Uncharacterized protein n=1 Tax=Phenylobacterium glaciei TaxID=2803784 RepID=A0A974S9G5_9CAUL|nr:hypothetical protein JKL49_10520 [Phenylobacterium glaciei]